MLVSRVYASFRIRAPPRGSRVSGLASIRAFCIGNTKQDPRNLGNPRNGGFEFGKYPNQGLLGVLWLCVVMQSIVS